MGDTKKPQGEDTRLTHAGRDPFDQYGFVNTPVYRGSTVLYRDLNAIESRQQPFTYGRRGTPTTQSLESVIAELEGAVGCKLAPSGAAAVTAALFSCTKAGDHILVPDSVYGCTRTTCNDMLSRFNVQTTYYDPTIGAGISDLMRPNTTLVFVESPGSQTFEVQDVPAISDIAHRHGATVVMDNTWASPLYFKPFEHGVDISVQACTKYIVGHADAMLGSVSYNADSKDRVLAAFNELCMSPGSEETFLGLRGIRTMKVRLKHHEAAALEIAHWLKTLPQVHRVLHPALPDCPGHEFWKRDFLGASGLFSIELKPIGRPALAAFLDHMEVFGMGYSWGGFESLIIPLDPNKVRTVVDWSGRGTFLRLHIGLESVDDLKADLEASFARMQKHA